VKKSDMMRFKSRKANSYIAIKQTDNKIELFLTRNLADLTIFKLDFISHEEKILVNFFYELNFILDLFIQKNIQFYIEENDYINCHMKGWCAKISEGKTRIELMKGGSGLDESGFETMETNEKISFN
jgi:hypothetical protein